MDPARVAAGAASAPRIHGLTHRLRPLRRHVTGGQRHDSPPPPHPSLGGSGHPRGPVLPDRGSGRDGDAFRAWLAQRNLEAVTPARKGRTNPQPHDPERYPARKAVERGLGWLTHGRRVATRYDQYAHRFLEFLYLAGLGSG